MLTKRKRPRRTTLTVEQIDAICEAVTLGLPFKHACYLTGTPSSSFFHWTKHARECQDRIARGERLRLTAPEKLWVKLFMDVNNARARFFRRNLASIQLAAQQPQNWTAAAWLCERLDPDEFGRQRVSVDLAAADNTDVRSPAQLAEAMFARTVGTETPEQPPETAEEAVAPDGAGD